MTTTRKFCCEDLFRFNNVNLDVLTETVGVPKINNSLNVMMCAVHPSSRGDDGRHANITEMIQEKEKDSRAYYMVHEKKDTINDVL